MQINGTNMIVNDAELRRSIMLHYIKCVTKQRNKPKTKLTMANWKAIESLNMIPPEFMFVNRLMAYKAYVFAPKNKMEELSGKSKNDGWYVLDRIAQNFFDLHIQDNFSPTIDYKYSDDGRTILSQKAFDKYLAREQVPLKEWLADPNTVDQFNKATWNQYANSLWQSNCTGTISKWEMDSLSFYYHEHELAQISHSAYGLTRWDKIPAEPVIVDEDENKKYPRYQLYTIVGTVLDKSAQRHMVTLLTPNGVATLKFYAASFAKYDQQISVVDPTTRKKKIVEKSWFLRGNKLVVTGFRRGDMFYPKRYTNSIQQHVLGLIVDVSSDGQHMQIEYERAEG